MTKFGILWLALVFILFPALTILYYRKKGERELIKKYKEEIAELKKDIEFYESTLSVKYSIIMRDNILSNRMTMILSGRLVGVETACNIRDKALLRVEKLKEKMASREKEIQHRPANVNRTSKSLSYNEQRRHRHDSDSDADILAMQLYTNNLAGVTQWGNENREESSRPTPSSSYEGSGGSFGGGGASGSWGDSSPSSSSDSGSCSGSSDSGSSGGCD